MYLRLILKLAIFVVIFTTTKHVYAVDFVRITNAATLSYQISPDNRIYFRNLHSYDSSFQGCCYAYYLDASTAFGKTIWSTVLAKIAANGSIWIGVENTSVNPSPVLYAGEW